MPKTKFLPLVPVESSNIKAIGYDNKIMQVQFHTGAIYQYEPVLQEAHEVLIQADSIGKHFNQHFQTNPTLTITKIKDKDAKPNS